MRCEFTTPTSWSPERRNIASSRAGSSAAPTATRPTGGYGKGSDGGLRGCAITCLSTPAVPDEMSKFLAELRAGGAAYPVSAATFSLEGAGLTVDRQVRRIEEQFGIQARVTRMAENAFERSFGKSPNTAARAADFVLAFAEAFHEDAVFDVGRWSQRFEWRSAASYARPPTPTTCSNGSARSSRGCHAARSSSRPRPRRRAFAQFGVARIRSIPRTVCADGDLESRPSSRSSPATATRTTHEVIRLASEYCRRRGTRLGGLGGG